MKYIIYILVTVFLLYSCKKENNNLGKNFISDNNLLISGAIDTFQLLTYTEKEDSLVSSNTSSALLGSYLDPIFGKVKSEFFTQIRISSNTEFTDANQIVLDSFVLALEYKGYYGNLTAQTFSVFEINEDLYLDTLYYTKDKKSTYSLDWVNATSKTQVPNPTSQVNVGGNLLSSQLRLSLDTTIARYFINQSNLNPDNFKDNESFTKFFKGLKVTVNDVNIINEGAILYFNLNSANSKMTIYYHYSNQTDIKKEYDFLINSYCADFNHIIFENESYKPGMILENKELGQEEFYTQANNSRAIVEIPFLKNIPKDALIQYAKLELPVNYYTFDSYYPSSTISAGARVIEGDNRLYSINVTGEYSDITKSYIVDLRDYIQKIHSGEIPNTPIYFAPSKMVSSMERIVFNGSNTIYKKKPKLYIKYTKF